MDSRYFSWAYLSALVVGLVAGMLVFREVFADAHDSLALVPRIVVAMGVYGALGVGFGYFRPERSWDWGLQLGLPAMVILGFPGLMALRHRAWFGFGLAVVLLAVVLLSAAGGGAVGARLGGRRRGAADGEMVG